MTTSYSAAETPLPLQARRARKQRGWTQKEVADRAGVSLRTYQLFEGEQSHPQPANMRAIADVLGLDVTAETVEARWEPDVQAYLDTIGYYMETLDDKERRRFISAEHRRLVQQIRASAATSAERAEAVEAMRAAVARQSRDEPEEDVTRPEV